MTTDYLSDEDAERMALAFWSEDRFEPNEHDIARIRRAWASRPASARALDDAALDLQTRKTVTPAALVLAARKRGVEITS